MFETQGGTRNRTQDLRRKGSAYVVEFFTSKFHLQYQLGLLERYHDDTGCPDRDKVDRPGNSTSMSLRPYSCYTRVVQAAPARGRGVQRSGHGQGVGIKQSISYHDRRGEGCGVAGRWWDSPRRQRKGAGPVLIDAIMLGTCIACMHVCCACRRVVRALRYIVVVTSKIMEGFSGYLILKFREQGHQRSPT